MAVDVLLDVEGPHADRHLAQAPVPGVGIGAGGEDEQALQAQVSGPLFDAIEDGFGPALFLIGRIDGNAGQFSRARCREWEQGRTADDAAVALE